MEHQSFTIVGAALPDYCRDLQLRCGTARGMALIFVLVLLTVMTMSGIAVMRTVDTGTLIAGNLAFQQSTLHATDRGIEAGIARLIAIADPTQNAGNDYLAARATGVTTANPIPAGLTATAPSNVIDDSAATGITTRFLIERMCIAAGAATGKNCSGGGSPYYRITARSAGPRNSVSFAQVMVRLGEPFAPKNAIVTNSDLSVSGDFAVTGALGGVHTNRNIKISAGGFANSGTTTASGSVTQNASGESVTGGQPTIAIPDINPSDFKSFADYILGADGLVYGYNNAGNRIVLNAAQLKAAYITTAGGDEVFKRTSTAPVVWELSTPEGNNWTGPPATFYVEGSFKIGGNPGQGVPGKLIISVIAEGSIDISGSPDMREHKCKWTRLVTDARTFGCALDPGTNRTAVPAGVQNIFLMAGADLKLSGNPTAPIAGILAAGEQVLISGNPNLTGYVFGQHRTSGVHSILSDTDGFHVSGKGSLQFDDNMENPWIDPAVRRLTWREVSP